MYTLPNQRDYGKKEDAYKLHRSKKKEAHRPECTLLLFDMLVNASYSLHQEYVHVVHVYGLWGRDLNQF